MRPASSPNPLARKLTVRRVSDGSPQKNKSRTLGGVRLKVEPGGEGDWGQGPGSNSQVEIGEIDDRGTGAYCRPFFTPAMASGAERSAGSNETHTRGSRYDWRMMN